MKADIFGAAIGAPAGLILVRLLRGLDLGPRPLFVSLDNQPSLYVDPYSSSEYVEHICQQGLQIISKLRKLRKLRNFALNFKIMVSFHRNLICTKLTNEI